MSSEPTSQLSFHYSTLSPDAFIKKVSSFMTQVSKLPSVSLTELLASGHLDGMFVEQVPERRQWMEMTEMFRAAGWDKRRCRALSYVAPGKYETTNSHRWFPPEEVADD